MPRVANASQWQLYPQYQAAAELPEGQWTHVRLVVEGSEARLYVGGSSEPTLVVPRLRGRAHSGSVGFWGVASGDNWAAAVSNIVIQEAEGEDAPQTAKLPASPSGFITSWEMSESMPADSGAVVAIPEIDGWTPVKSDEDGLVNLSDAYGQPDGRNTVFLRRQLQAPEDLIVPLDVTYSDEITVFLNGRPLYSGVNELTIAVTDEAFGWGLIARLAPGSGLLE